MEVLLGVAKQRQRLVMHPDHYKCCKVGIDKHSLQKLAEVFRFAYCSEPICYPLGPPPTDDEIVPLGLRSKRSINCQEFLLLHDLYSGEICNN